MPLHKNDNKKTKVNIYGGGSASIFAACLLDPNKFEISIFEKNKALGRKFLVAGKGGFNLTHTEDKTNFIERYLPKEPLIKPFNKFDNIYFRKWLEEIGIQTYVGTSKRVFPIKGIKPIDVLNAIEKKLNENKVRIVLNHNWQDFEEVHKTNENAITIFAFGGASWKVTGSDGSWIEQFNKNNITTIPFQASNCAFQINWSKSLIDNIDGEAIKNAVFSCGNKTHKGEAVLTQFGIEGSGVYPLSSEVREALNKNNKTIIHIDLKPDLTVNDIIKKLSSVKANRKQQLEKTLHLSKAGIELIKANCNKEDYLNDDFIAQLIKKLPLEIIGLAPIDEAISTVGGISFDELTDNFELKKLPDHFCIGEMLDWDAPTGGYLLQMCFSMAAHLANHLNTNF
ncbi:MAG: NAD(P)/FAD-dependent oxidoreductase [Sphingobacteriaceae bacterium]